MRAILLYIILLISNITTAQDRQVHKTNDKVRGLVKKATCVWHMVRMVNDTLVYGEMRGLYIYHYNEVRQLYREQSVAEYSPADTTITIYDYDSNGNLVQCDKYMNKEKYKLPYSYVFKDGQLKEEGLVLNNRKGPSVKYLYYQDSIVTLHCDSSGIVQSKNVELLDDKQNVIETRFCLHDQVVAHSVYDYDLFNNIVSCEVYMEDDLEATYTYEYEYDRNHNFTKRIEYKNKRIYSITTRSIEYW